VDPFPDPLLLRKSGSAGNRGRTSGSTLHHWRKLVRSVPTVVNTIKLSNQPDKTFKLLYYTRVLL
jgi:hypothetical protein